MSRLVDPYTFRLSEVIDFFEYTNSIIRIFAFTGRFRADLTLDATVAQYRVK